MREVTTTPRLVLRELEPHDLDAVAALLGDAEVMRFWERSFRRSDAADWLQRQRDRYTRDGHGYWLALLKATGEPVGQIGLLTLEIDGVAEQSLGMILQRAYWGQGLATEGAAAAVDYGFDIARARRVTSLVRPENIPSLRVMWRLGLHPEALVTHAGFAHLLLAIERNAWAAQRPQVIRGASGPHPSGESGAGAPPSSTS